MRVSILLVCFLSACGGESQLADARVPQPDSGPLAIGACDALPASGTWEQITPPGDLGDSQAIALHPREAGTIYVQMHKGGNGSHFPTDGLFVSRNCGASWERITPGRNASDPGTNVHSGSFAAIAIDPTDADVMYIASNYGPGGIWKSVNGGVDWDQTVPGEIAQHLGNPSVPGMWFNALSMDPTDHLHLVGATHNGCLGEYAPNCLAETRDGGESWHLIPVAAGGEAHGTVILNESTMIYGTPQMGAFLTTDGGAHWAQIAQGVNVHDDTAYRSASGTFYLPSDYGVLRSTDFLTWTSIEGSDRTPTMVGTGTHLITARRFAFDFSIADENAPTSWGTLAASGGPGSVDQGAVWLRYDPTHHVLYASAFGTGLWRLLID